MPRDREHRIGHEPPRRKEGPNKRCQQRTTHMPSTSLAPSPTTRPQPNLTGGGPNPSISHKDPEGYHLDEDTDHHTIRTLDMGKISTRICAERASQYHWHASRAPPGPPALYNNTLQTQEGHTPTRDARRMQRHLRAQGLCPSSRLPLASVGRSGASSRRT